MDAAFFSYQLRAYSGTHRYTAAILAYVFGAGAFMAVAAPNFGGLFKRQQVLEGAYRALHARLRANAEPVAFYGGVGKEGGVVRAKFREVVAHAARLLGVQWRFSMVQDFLLKYFGATVAVALIVGPFFAGHMRPEASVAGRAQMLSNMRYHTAVVISLFGALGTLGASSRKFLKLGAYADRVAEMERVMREIRGGAAAGEPPARMSLGRDMAPGSAACPCVRACPGARVCGRQRRPPPLLAPADPRRLCRRRHPQARWATPAARCSPATTPWCLRAPRW